MKNFLVTFSAILAAAAVIFGVYLYKGWWAEKSDSYIDSLNNWSLVVTRMNETGHDHGSVISIEDNISYFRDTITNAQRHDRKLSVGTSHKELRDEIEEAERVMDRAIEKWGSRIKTVDS